MPKDWEPIWDEEIGCWKVDFSIGGQRFRRRLGIRDASLRRLAKRRAKALYEEEWERHIAPPPAVEAPLFFEAAKAYIEAGGEARFLPPILTYFGAHTRIDEIDDATIFAAELDIYPSAQPGTRRRQVKTPILAVLRHARGERAQPRQERRRTRWLTPEEAERLLTAAAALTLPRHAQPERETLRKIAFLLGSGSRPGECFAALCEDWNAPTRQIWIAGEEVGAGKTALSSRWIRLPERAVEIMGDGPGEGRLFRTPYGKPIQMRANGGGQMQTAFNRARDAAGLGPDVTPYTLRHTWATWFYAQTRDFGELLDFGGWAKADTANIYRKIAPDDLAARLYAHGWDFTRPNIQAPAKLRTVR